MKETLGSLRLYMRAKISPQPKHKSDDMNMQVCNYGEGLGGVIHKVTGSFKGRCSVWFNADGTMSSACQYHWNGTRAVERDVKPGGPIWNEIESVTRAIRFSQK